MSSVDHDSPHQSLSDRPERSRNAKAQARHRAKRKAYIEQLETTVTKLQTAIGITPDQVEALPPPFVKIRELEQENVRLQRENDELRRALSNSGGRSVPDYPRRNSPSTFQDPRECEYKKRKVADIGTDVYMSPRNPPHSHEPLTRLPALTIPNNAPSPHSYGSSLANHAGGTSGGYGLNGPAFHMPDTPSGSSSTSSPPFSAITLYRVFTHQQPVRMQPASQSPVNHRPPPMSAHHTQPTYSQYGTVKVEDSHYHNGHHSAHNGHHDVHYASSVHTYPQQAQAQDLNSWSPEAYHVGRVPLHR
ncbi:hypothetical protein PLICRDRAFT_173636 [Plicaturopsis crispa FD-325 SS-3]|nr:hypothetical protein PLICRDRAFT_173636 [Plicaturopsis crispa FD-325 SS-3]